MKSCTLNIHRVGTWVRAPPTIEMEGHGLINALTHLGQRANCFVVLELCESELIKRDKEDRPLKNFNEDECRDYFQQLLLGVEYRTYQPPNSHGILVIRRISDA